MNSNNIVSKYGNFVLLYDQNMATLVLFFEKKSYIIYPLPFFLGCYSKKIRKKKHQTLRFSSFF